MIVEGGGTAKSETDEGVIAVVVGSDSCSCRVGFEGGD